MLILMVMLMEIFKISAWEQLHVIEGVEATRGSGAHHPLGHSDRECPVWCHSHSASVGVFSGCSPGCLLLLGVKLFLFIGQGHGYVQNAQRLMPARYERLLASVQLC